MSKQLLIYERVVPLNSERHRDWSVKAASNLEFARNVNSVPLTAVEFPGAALEYPIVFAGDGDNVVPAAIMGIEADKNLFLDDAGKLQSRYLPAFLRRYPFVFSTADDGKTFALCIDESFEGFNDQGRGERLFDADGEQTQYLKSVLAFLSEYQAQFARTQAFCKKLQELELLEPVGAQYSGADGQRRTLTGFKAIPRAKLQQLPADKLEELSRTGELELAYVHLQSLGNLASLVAKAGASRAGAAKAPPAAGDATTGDAEPVH